jgi:hypothetical protein
MDVPVQSHVSTLRTVCVCCRFVRSCICVCKGCFLSFERACIARTPKLSTPVLSTCSNLCFRPPGTHTKRRLCVIRPVCAYRWHPQLTARTAWYSERSAHTRWTCSTHFTLPFRPSRIGVCSLFCLVLMSFPEFYTQLAPWQIKPPSPCSTQIQESDCVLCLYHKSLYCAHCRTEREGTLALAYPRAHVEHHFFNRHMGQCRSNKGKTVEGRGDTLFHTKIWLNSRY